MNSIWLMVGKNTFMCPVCKAQITGNENIKYQRYCYWCGTKMTQDEEATEWIPVKYRPLTVDERIAFAEHYGIEYCDTADEKAFDCPMPEDKQEILVSRSWGVSTDVAENDIDGEGFSYYGLEGNGDWEGIDAWMPLPEPYKKGGTE